MVLSAYERSVVTELLSGLSDDDLLQVAKTVSHAFIKVPTTERALDVILLHSPCVESILSRKKISKQLLFNYLHYKQIPVEPTLSKEEIMNKVLNYWTQNALSWTPDTHARQIQHAELSTSHFNVDQAQQLNPSEATQPSQDTQQIVSNINVDELGYEFIKWFTTKFNACTATTEYLFDHTMFFTNASAEFQIVRNVSGQDVQNSNLVESDVLIGQAFSQLQRTYNLLLNMNLDSMKVKRNSYGNILVGSCGSLHSSCQPVGNPSLSVMPLTSGSPSQLVGVYEILFQLFHDPLCNLSDKPVWKVQKVAFSCKFANREIEPGGSGDLALEYDVSYGNR